MNDYLAEFLKESRKNSPLIQFPDTGVIEGVYYGGKVEDDPFDPQVKRVVYTLGIEGKKKMLISKSVRLANQMRRVAPDVGDSIRIKREGERFETTYTVTLLSSLRG